MSIVASGSSLGGTLHPIMLNNLFNGHVGFQNGVRASAGLLTGCLVLAICMMHPRRDGEAFNGKNGKESARRASEESGAKDDNSAPGLERTQLSLGAAIKKFFRDPPYVILLLS